MDIHAFSDPVAAYGDRRLPEPARPAGYAALITDFDLSVPLPATLSAIAERHRVYEQGSWRIFGPRYAPDPTLEGHLVFALKNEGLDLCVLKRLFDKASRRDLEAMISAKPGSAYMRRIWFLFEWLTGERLDLDDAPPVGAYADVVDTDQQYAAEAKTSTRHRVRNNLPGDREFCPLVRRTPAIDAFRSMKLDEKARKITGAVSNSVLARAAAFLLLKDSRSSYAIEGEAPSHSRIQRWGKAIGQAGQYPLDAEELLRLQRIVMGDARFVRLGFRDEGGFVGDHAPDTRIPLPVHISARHDDLESLVGGLIAFNARHGGGLDPIIAAAVLAFGFVYIHPFADGNGRIHRYLIHHVLAERSFSPRGMAFPISSVIFDRMDDYRHVLESYSERLLPVIEWRPTEKMNVDVLNETADFYRYFDATPHVTFLYECVQRTIEHDLPEEVAFLERYDRFRAAIGKEIEMPDSTIDLLFNFLRQNGGKLSKRAREKEFAALRPHELARVEALYSEAFSAPEE
ncbi:filamentation induced by cAMP protein fic [Hyphomonas polymorpha PS728]|uniref:Filamentation induced by cAMP protein fic n=1 Tax=Hyphomonas polymorpha PS728 TaxID=1280954 RepID=A0A062VFX5_9PROT|nr:Fic family protein [Hyphomonas polymorpha]KCZ97424.1 filamentation induced by cAMP protein fic [Hyphomonas polymorpha PS728]